MDFFKKCLNYNIILCFKLLSKKFISYAQLKLLVLCIFFYIIITIIVDNVTYKAIKFISITIDTYY